MLLRLCPWLLPIHVPCSCALASAALPAERLARVGRGIMALATHLRALLRTPLSPCAEAQAFLASCARPSVKATQAARTGLAPHMSSARGSEAAGASATGASPQSSAASTAPASGSADVFFEDLSDLIDDNTPELRYGVCASDLDSDGQVELFVCGFGSRNRLLKWSRSSGRLEDAEVGSNSAELEDTSRLAIGVAAADIDGDGREEIYVLNTDTFGGRKRVGDRLFDLQTDKWVDLFSLPQNMDDANSFAGRSVCAVDRFGSGQYGFFVANYGGPMKLFELSQEGFLADTAREAGLVMYPTGGRALVSLPLISYSSMDIFAGNEGGPNFLFVNKGNGSGRFVESAAAYGLLDAQEHCRGVAVVDVDSAGELGLCTGNWEGPHRLFRKAGPGPKGGAAMLGFTDVPEEAGGFQDVAPSAMAEPSRVRTVIAADLDNDGYEELFFNNIGSNNRLFRQESPGKWVEVPLGAMALPNGLGTGGAVADIDGDGLLELLITHGESGRQPMALFRCALPSARSNAWLRVQPLTKQGAPARGATVRLRDSSGRWQKRAIDAGSGYLCCMEPVAHFGLGQVGGAVHLRITWPDGTVKDVEGVVPNQLLQIRHP